MFNEYIVDSDFVHEVYNIVKGVHCKKFAKNIFDRVASSKKCNFQKKNRKRFEKYVEVPATAIIAEPTARVFAGAANCYCCCGF